MIVVASIALAAWRVHEHRVLVALLNREDIPNPVKAKPIANIHVSPMQPVPFKQAVLDNRRGNHKAKVIIDPDGRGSVVAAIDEPSTVKLYRTDHRSFSIAHPGYIGGDEDAQVADIDGDGTPDIVTGGQNFIVSVLLNPRRSACSNVYRCPWSSLTIDRGRNSHDVQIGDVNGNGRPDVVTEQGVYFNEDGGRHWDFAGREVIPRDGQGTTVGVLDADGIPDIVAPFHSGTMLARFVNPRHHRGDPLHERWQADVIDAHPRFTGNMSTAIADVDHDGRNDIVLAPMYGGGGLVWYQAPSTPGAPWRRHLIDPTINFVHQGSLKVADFDGDGCLDVAFAEQDQSPTLRVGVFYNVNGDGSKWKLQVLSTSGGHNIRVGVLGRDALPSIVSARWGYGAAPDPLVVWRNVRSVTRGAVRARCGAQQSRMARSAPGSVRLARRS